MCSEYPDKVACNTFFIGPHQQIATWTYLRERYQEKVIREAAAKTACGCAVCTRHLLEAEKKP